MGVKYRGEFGNHKGECFVIEIDRLGYGGVVQMMEFTTECVQLFYPEKGIFDPVFTSGVELSVWQDHGDQYADLFLTSERVNKLSIYQKVETEKKLLWKGWINTDIYEYDLMPCPRTLTIPASCGLSEIENYTPNFDASQKYTAISTVLTRCLIGTWFTDDLLVNCSLRAQGSDHTLLTDCLVLTETLFKEGQGALMPRNAKEILSDLLLSFGCRISHQRGLFRIDRMPNLITPSAQGTLYKYDGSKTPHPAAINYHTVGDTSIAWTQVPRVSMDSGYGCMNISVKNRIRNSFASEQGALMAGVDYWRDGKERKAWYDLVDSDDYYRDSIYLTHNNYLGQMVSVRYSLSYRETEDENHKRIYIIKAVVGNFPIGNLVWYKSPVGMFKRNWFNLKGAEKITISLQAYMTFPGFTPKKIGEYLRYQHNLAVELILNNTTGGKLHYTGQSLASTDLMAHEREMGNVQIAAYEQWQTVTFDIDIKDKGLEEYSRYTLVIYPIYYDVKNGASDPSPAGWAELHVKNISVKADSRNYESAFDIELKGTYKREIEPLEFVYNTDVGDTNLINTIYRAPDVPLQKIVDGTAAPTTIMEQLIVDRMTLYGEPRQNITMTTEHSIVLGDDVIRIANDPGHYSLKSVRSRLSEASSDLTVEFIKPNDVTLIYE